VPEFVGPFELLLNSERVIQLTKTGGLHNNAQCLARVKKFTLMASNSFHSLNVSNSWNIPSSRRHVVAQGRKPATCDNCDGDHYAPDCTVPRDEAKIKKAKDDWAARKEKSQQGRGGGGYGGERGGQQHKKWGDNNNSNNNNMGAIQTMEVGLEWHTVATRGCAIASARLAAGITLTLQGFTQIGRA